MFDSQNCHLCGQSKPYEMCTCFLKHTCANVVPFEGNAAITISTPRQSKEVAGDEDNNPNSQTHDVTEFNISIQENTAVPSAEFAEDCELNEKKEKFLLEASKCISNDDKLWHVGIMLEARDKDITEIRTNNGASINLCAFKMLLFCYEKKKCEWEDFLSDLEITFQKINMANEFERLRNLWKTLIK